MKKASFHILYLMLFISNTSFADYNVWEKLKEGGKVALIRHAPVEKGKDKGDPLLRGPSCAGERNLSSEGRNEAKVLGKLFIDKRIPVSRVYHSPFCRTTETAELDFVNVAAQEYLSLIEILPPEKVSAQTEKLNKVIGSYNDDGNLILITHEPNIMTVSFETVRYLDIVVFQPLGGDEFEEIGVIRFFN